MSSPNPALPPSATRRRLGALFLLLVGLGGLGVSGYLTVLKFRMAYTPCLTERGGCNIGGLSCEDALNSAWSTLLGLPISLWGAAFYLVVVVLAFGLVRRPDFLRNAAPALLLGLAWFDVLVSVILGIYAFGVLRSPCPFCISLYLVSALLLGGAWLLRRAQTREDRAAALERLRQAAVLDSAFLLAVIFVVATGVQSVVYQYTRRLVDAQSGCPEPVKTLPLASIKIGASEPKAIVALFIDMTCSHCKAEFKVVVNALNNKQFPEPTQLWIYHTPRQPCDPEAFPAGYAKSDDSVRYDNACLAARAAECMEKLQPGAGIELIGGMYALHDDREPNVPLFTAERIGNQAVELEMEIDPDDPDNKLFTCINNDKTVLTSITEHQRYAEDPKFKVPTLAVYHAIAGLPDMSRKAYYGDANTPLAALADYISKQANPPPGN
jgi:uncharacterized membrane protein